MQDKKHFVRNKYVLRLICFLPLCLASLPVLHAEVPAPERVIVAYVTSWTETMPDPSLMTHINYAFGHVTDSFDGVRIDNGERLRRIVAAKENVKVCLSVGGWGSGRFSEMAATEARRKAFAASCATAVDEYGLDGIDIDWEYPTVSTAGISSSPKDTEHFTLLMQELRAALGPDRLLTLASASNARHIDFPAILPYIDWVNVMAYDMGWPPHHNAALYQSPRTGQFTADDAVKAHLAAGIPAGKIVMGMPFYGRGKEGYADFVDYKDIPAPLKGHKEKWDPKAKVPYYADAEGLLVFSFDNVRSIGEKCLYVLKNGLLGGMYWEYCCDNADSELARTVAEQLLPRPFVSAKAVRAASYAGKQPRFRALLYYSEHVEEAHLVFARQAAEFFRELSFGHGFILDQATSLPDDLSPYNVIIMPNAAPSKPEERARFERYMEEGGGWVGFHGAGYNDQSTSWDWFRAFLGGGRFLCNNWPPQPALMEVESCTHPVTRNLPEQFVAPASEFYQWQPDPRSNPSVQVLVSISETNFPFGIKDVVFGGDFPVVWTNRDYRMIYLNMGHGGHCFSDATQNLLFVNAFRWVVSCAGEEDPFLR